MHGIEPYYGWREDYIVEEDERLPFYNKEYQDFEYANTIYNYYIHPEWDYIGSKGLYLKIIYANHQENYAFIELLGEWNDCIENDVMLMINNVLRPLRESGITRIFLICDNLMNFFYDNDDYYEELAQDLIVDNGFLIFLNFPEHLNQEKEGTVLGRDFYFLDFVDWRKYKPYDIYDSFTKRLVLDSPKNY